MEYRRFWLLYDQIVKLRAREDVGLLRLLPSAFSFDRKLADSLMRIAYPPPDLSNEEAYESAKSRLSALKARLVRSRTKSTPNRSS